MSYRSVVDKTLTVMAVGTALLATSSPHAATSCLEESGSSTCCESWIADTWEGRDPGAIRSKTIEGLQKKIKESVAINRMWCRNVPHSQACQYRVEAPRCDPVAAPVARREPTLEERHDLINRTRLLLREWENRLQEAMAAQRGANLYLGVGRVAQSYFDALADAQQKLKTAKALLQRVVNGAGGTVIRQLDATSKELDAALIRVNAARHAVDDARREESEPDNADETVQSGKAPEIKQVAPGVSVIEFPGAQRGADCPDLSSCLSVHDAVWDMQGQAQGTGAMRVTLSNTCPSAVRVLLVAPYHGTDRRTRFELAPGETGTHTVSATQNSWTAAASQRGASEACLMRLTDN